MLIEISEKSKMAYEAAATKLGQPTTLPDLSALRPDLALWLTANLMLATIIEAEKNGDIRDYTDHSKPKYEIWHRAKNGYEPGSGGGFSYRGYGYVFATSRVGARLTFNGRGEGCKNAEDYPDLWEIIMLNVK